MVKKEKNFFRKKFIVTDLVSLRISVVVDSRFTAAPIVSVGSVL